MHLLVEQLQRRVAELAQWLDAEHGPPAEVRLIRQDDPRACRPDYDDHAAPLLEPGGDWREPLDTTRWLRWHLTRPAHWPPEDTALLVQRFGSSPLEPASRVGRWLQRLQGLLYLDGTPYHGLDQFHRRIPLPAGPDYAFAASVWTGLVALDWQPAPVFRLVRVDRGATALEHDLRVLHDALACLASDHPARPELERLAEATLRAIDWGRPGSDAFRASLAHAHALLAEGLGRLAAAGASREPTIAAVGHAHIDCAWLWTLAQTREKAARTWSTALRLMERYPEYHFLASTPFQYELVKRHFPAVFAGIRERVREGRWEPSGGMWVEADCNLPDGESLVRQILLGTRYVEREFGLPTSVLWLPDSFGFSWALPTLMAAAGIPHFVTHKLSWNQTNRIPHDTFRWRGPDGAEVLAHFLCMPEQGDPRRTTYNATLLPSTVQAAWRRFQDKGLQQELLAAFGWGDGGGGPTSEMLEAARRLHDLPGFPRVRMSTARAFFERLERALAGRDDVPVWDGELYFEYHRGTYTSQARQKLRNALAQRLYHAAELYAATARALLGAHYPRAALEEGWRLILTNQFHDILPGSAIAPAYVDAEADFQRLSASGDEVLETATRSLAAALALDADSLVVFNPQPYASAEYLELPAEYAASPPLDDAGEPLPAQPTPDGGLLVFCADVPPNGYRAFPLGRTEPTATPTTRADGPLHVSPRQLDTPFWRIELDDHGRIARLLDKARGREVLPAGALANRLVVFEDKPLDFDAWDIDAFFTAKARDVDQIEAASEAGATVHAQALEHLEAVRVVEAGPQRAVLECRWRFGERTRILQRLCVYARSPRIDFVTEVDWHERQSLLKVAFPTTIRNRRATYEIQFGTIDRPTHRNTSWDEAQFEVPAQRWADLSDAHSGVALLADCKHGYSVSDRTLWLSLLRSPIDPDPEADRGRHQFTYSLLPHGPGLDDVRRAAYALTRPLLWRREPAHPGPLPPRFSLAQASPAGVLVETAKWAEDQDVLVLRLYEADGGATAATLALGIPAESVEQVDLLERRPRPLAHADGGTLALDLRAREVITLLVRSRPGGPERPSAGAARTESRAVVEEHPEGKAHA